MMANKSPRIQSQPRDYKEYRRSGQDARYVQYSRASSALPEYEGYEEEYEQRRETYPVPRRAPYQRPTYTPEPRRATPKRRTYEQVNTRAVMRRRILLFVAGIVLVAGLFVQVYQMAVLSQCTGQLTKLQDQAAQLESQRQNLEVKLSELSRVSRIEEKAAALGMVYASADQLRELTLP